jgi:hypothetical protein
MVAAVTANRRDPEGGGEGRGAGLTTPPSCRRRHFGATGLIGRVPGLTGHVPGRGGGGGGGRRGGGNCGDAFPLGP